MNKTKIWETDLDEMYRELERFLKKQRLWVIQQCIWITHSKIINSKTKHKVISIVLSWNFVPSILIKWKEIGQFLSHNPFLGL